MKVEIKTFKHGDIVENIMDSTLKLRVVGDAPSDPQYPNSFEAQVLEENPAKKGYRHGPGTVRSNWAINCFRFVRSEGDIYEELLTALDKLEDGSNT